MSIIKRSFLVVIVAIILLTTIIIPVSAVDTTYHYLVPNPVTNGADGYVILPFHYSNSYIPAECIWWTITTVIGAHDTGSEPIVSFSQTGTNTSITFGTNDSSAYYLLNIYFMWNGDDNSNNVYVDKRPIRLNSSYTMSLDFPSGYSDGYFIKPSIFSGFTSFESTSTTAAFSYDAVFAEASPFYTQLININSTFDNLLSKYITKTDLTNSKLDTLISQSTTIINHFVSLLSKVDYTNEQLDTIVSQFTELLEVSWSISSSLDEFVYYYWEEFATYTFPLQISEICGRLDLILKALNRSGDTEQTTVNSDKVDEYADVEQSLVNNDEAKSAISDFEISIDGQSYSFIWELVTRIFNSHPEVFGLVITILTLGFLALILNR